MTKWKSPLDRRLQQRETTPIFGDRSFNSTQDRGRSMKVPKGQSESVNRRMTENTMDKRKRTKGQTTIYKT